MNGVLIFLQITSLDFALQVNDGGGSPRSGLAIWEGLFVGQQSRTAQIQLPIPKYRKP
jgi:hypothetical protein